jgi:hypothetical protein
MPDLGDFTEHDRPTEPFTFTIGAETYECCPVLPAGVIDDLVVLATAHQDQEIDPFRHGVMICHMLDKLLLPESAQRFIDKMGDPADPITMEQIGAVAVALMEAHGRRPLPLSASSGPGPGSTGPSSTDGAPPEVSTPWAFGSTDS